MNQAQCSFAQPVPSGVAAEGRSLVAPPCGAPATIPYQQQTWTDTERGRAREVMCPSALDVAQDWSLRRAGLIGANNCRGRNNPVFLATGHGSSRAPAINIKPTRCGHLKCVSQRLPSHRLNSLRYGPEPKRTGDQRIGNLIQGRD